MIQTIKKDYKNLDKAVENINSISMTYDYFKDYTIINNPNNDTCTALLKFDVPKNYKSLATLNLAKLKDSNDTHILGFHLNIKFEDETLKDAEIFKNITCKTFGNSSLQLRGMFGVHDYIDFVKIYYIDEKSIKVTLRKACYDGSFYSEEQPPLVCEQVDCAVLYNHIINVYLQRGYLFDLRSLETFYSYIKSVCSFVNERKLEHEKFEE